MTKQNLLNNAAFLVLEVANQEKDEEREKLLRKLYEEVRAMQALYHEGA